MACCKSESIIPSVKTFAVTGSALDGRSLPASYLPNPAPASPDSLPVPAAPSLSLAAAATGEAPFDPPATRDSTRPSSASRSRRPLRRVKLCAPRRITLPPPPPRRIAQTRLSPPALDYARRGVAPPPVPLPQSARAQHE
ncbi:unnamed protein product [Urochloa humidicola]